MESFKVENINIPTIHFKVNSGIDNGILELQTEIMGRITAELIKLKSEAIRSTLIEMGWTPPADA